MVIGSGVDPKLCSNSMRVGLVFFRKLPAHPPPLGRFLNEGNTQLNPDVVKANSRGITLSPITVYKKLKPRFSLPTQTIAQTQNCESVK